MKWVDKIYIISLDSATIRRDTIKNDLLSAGFDETKIEWVSAIDGNTLDINQLLLDGTISSKYRDYSGVLSKSIYGCALSHQNIYKDFLKQSDMETALILEDDASLTHTALRTFIGNTPAYDYFLEDTKNIDWDVIQLGQVSKHMNQIDDDSIDTKILKRMKMPTTEWAAHSYIINKRGASKLIENNTPIQFAADTNIHTSDTNVYCPPVSYFLQKNGNHHSWMIGHLSSKFAKHILYETDEFDLQYQSKTYYGDLIKKEEHLSKPIFELGLSRAIDYEKVTFESFEIANGDVLTDWLTIYLKEDNL